MLKKIFLVLAVVVLALCIYAALQPAVFTIARSISIQATPEEIFPHINNSKKANDWMPWKDIDKEVMMVEMGPEEGIGSGSKWDSKGQMGTGQAVVVESIPNQKVVTQLTYTKPMAMTQLATVSLSGNEGGGTTVRWEVTGENSFMARLMCIFMNMDKVVGEQFEKGLTNLKNIVEGKK